MNTSDAEFDVWCDDLIQVFKTGYGYGQKEAEQYVHGNRSEWREYFDDGYTVRQAAAYDLAAGGRE